MERRMQGIRIAVRSLRRTPGFAVTAVLTLALGIGLSVAVFTVAEALLLRKLPFRDQNGLVVLWTQPADRSFDHYPLSLARARDFARSTRTLERVAFATYEGAWPIPIREADRMSRLRQALVSGDFFDVLGAQPVLGRALRVEDDVIGAAPVVVLSYVAWQGHFAGSSEVLGRQIVVHGNGVGYTIVGVMPRGFDYPRGVDFWAPLVPMRTNPGSDSTFADVDLIGRLRSGATPVIARDELTAFYGRVGDSPWARSLHGVANPLPRLILGDTKPAVLVFAVASLMLLVITCVNVANLLLVRGLARTREVAVRSALGASRGRVIAQLLAENAVLAIGGGALGIAVATAAVGAFVAFAPAGLPRLDEIQVNATALAGAVGITAVAMMLFGLAPAIMTSRVELQEVLRAGTRQSMNRGSRLATEVLVVGQVALAVLVLSAAGLIARSLIKLERAELSFEPSHLLIGELAFKYDQVDTKEKQLALLDRLVPAVRAVPGVQAVSPVVAIPFSGSGGWDISLAAEGQSAVEATGNPVLNMDVVVPEYFITFGITLVRGRGFTDQDREGTPGVVVISQSTAHHFWPGADPIGKRVKLGIKAEETATVVGVVPDTRYRELQDPRPSVYFPLRQSPFPFAPMNLAIRTRGAPADLVSAVRRAVGSIDPGIGLASAAPFGSFLDGPLAPPRLNALLLAVFAGAAVALAAIGLFGVMATMVGQRTREFGVRMALGATGQELRLMVMRRGLTLATIGVVTGLLGALLANRLLLALLYQVSPTDPATLSIVVVLLLTVAGLASLFPARSSTRIDPVQALRADG
jgi:putative ABC transport system permease protein